MTTIGLFTVVLISIANLLLGFIVLSQNPRARAYRAFAFICVAIAFWASVNYLVDYVDGSLTLLFTRLTLLGGVLIAIAIIMLSWFFPVNQGSQNSLTGKNQIYLAVIVGILALTPFIAADASSVDVGVATFTYGAAYWLYVLYFIQAVIAVDYNLWIQIRSARSSRQKSQVIAVIAGLHLFAILAIVANVLIPLVSEDWTVMTYGPIFSLLFVMTIAYAIVKHGLFDIKLAAVRSVAYALSLLALAGVYYIVAYLVSMLVFQGDVSNSFSLSPLNILLALGLAFIFQPIKSFFDRTTDKIFFRDRYNSEDFFGRVNELFTSTTDLRSLLQRVSLEVGDTLKSEQAFMFVMYNDGGNYTSAGTKNRSQLPIDDIRTLNSHVSKKGDEIIVASILDEEDAIHRLLISHNIAILMPLMRKNTILGYLSLGDKQAGNYTDRDIKVLRTIADGLVVAIQNALSIQEVKDINAHLQQRIDAATKELKVSNARLRHLDSAKDEFLSMASHQLRTPLTSVKGYLSMVLDGDAGKVTEMQRRLLGEAFTSSERMVGLIHDFLNVSRLQTGKFILEKHPTDIKKLVSDEVRALERAASARGIKLETIFEGDIPDRVNIDESKFQQVVMNYIDNALYYSRDVNRPVEVRLQQTGGNLELRVVDSGIGVPKTEQARLFNKFYRASNARKQRPDGTGVGIYLAKKVVTEHGGDVIFESVEGEGSTFGFWLPLNGNTIVEASGEEPK